VSNSDDKRRDDAFESGDEYRLSDEEINAAIAGFEREMNAEEGFASGKAPTSSDADNAALGNSGEGSAKDADQSAYADTSQEGNAEDPTSTNGEGPDVGLDFDDELEGLIGNKAKIATIITRLSSAELLAAFCHLADVSASCVDTPEGAFAVLRDLTGDEPENAVGDLTSVISGLSAVLAVNRADKLEATLWLNGASGETFSPPVLFASTSSCVEDLLIGASTLSMVQVDGYAVTDTAGLNDESAMEIINRHTRPGFSERGASSEDE
jgi:hypothetical protein